MKRKVALVRISKQARAFQEFRSYWSQKAPRCALAERRTANGERLAEARTPN
jgi:hypothetical protein